MLGIGPTRNVNERHSALLIRALQFAAIPAITLRHQLVGDAPDQVSVSCCRCLGVRPAGTTLLRGYRRTLYTIESFDNSTQIAR